MGEFDPTKPANIQKDALGFPGINVEIGSTTYFLSSECFSYFYSVRTSSYDRIKSVLAIGEPHSNGMAQYSLFKGLEQLFTEHPDLVKKTIFLAEGFPAGEPISIQSLIDADSNPTDELVRQTLDSFLITGYMAYEWKYQQGIPIIGTENKELYDLSREFASWYVDDPNAIMANVGIKETETKVRVIRLPVEAGWNFAINVRNRSIAETLIGAMYDYENPMLFVGSGHLNTRQGEETFDILQSMAIDAVDQGIGIFFNYLKTVDPRSLENHSIHHYLQAQRIGYTFLEPLGLPNKREDMTYQRLFQAQLAGKRVDRDKIDYEGYLSWLLANKDKYVQHTTVEPNPKAAAEFVRRLKEKRKEPEQKSGIIYEDHSDYAHWFYTRTEEVNGKIKEKFGVDSIWKLEPFLRGRAYELMRDAEPASNLEHVDDIKYEARTVTGMKTIELRDPTYRDINNLDRRIRDCIDELIGFPGGVWRGKRFDRGKDFDDVYLEIGIPKDKATMVQIEKILEMQDYAQEKGLTLVINEVP